MFSFLPLKSSKTLMELCVINLGGWAERESGREGGREGGKGGREGGRERREGGREEGREGGREGEKAGRGRQRKFNIELLHIDLGPQG